MSDELSFQRMQSYARLLDDPEKRSGTFGVPSADVFEAMRYADQLLEGLKAATAKLEGVMALCEGTRCQKKSCTLLAKDIEDLIKNG